MEKQTTELIEQLAAKLGTTTEYLWGVLIKQAPVYAVTSLLEIGVVLIMGVVLWKSHKKLLSPINDNPDECLYDNYEDLQWVIGILTFIWVILFVVAFFTFANVITSIANPEYWALMKILDKL